MYMQKANKKTIFNTNVQKDFLIQNLTLKLAHFLHWHGRSYIILVTWIGSSTVHFKVKDYNFHIIMHFCHVFILANSLVFVEILNIFNTPLIPKSNFMSLAYVHSVQTSRHHLNTIETMTHKHWPFEYPQHMFWLLYKKRNFQLHTPANMEAWSGGYKNFSYSTQLNMKFILLINVKMPTLVDI